MKPPFFAFLFAMLLFIAGTFAADSLPPVPAPNIPPSQLEAAKRAKDFFEAGNFHEAETIYATILAAAPNNLYVLSNLGVVRFRAGKLTLAAETLRRAIAVAPADGFSHRTLGILYYTQGNYDEAVNSLTKAIALNPKDANAYQYLSIVAAKKGWSEAARKALGTATTLDPSLKTEPEHGDFLTPQEKSGFQLPRASK